MYNINEANELLDAIEILAEKSAKNNAVIYSGIVTEISTSVCTMKINGNTYSNIVYYGGTPIVGNAYRVFVPFGNMSQAFTLIFADTSPGESGVQSVNGKTGDVVLTAVDVGAIAYETDPTVPGWAKQPEKPTYTATEVGALPDTYTPPVDSTLTQSGQAADAAAVGNRLSALSEAIANLQTSGLTTAQINALDGMFKVCAFTKDNVSAEYTAFKTAFGITDSGGETEVTLTSISVTYSGGDVAVGTAVADLTGIVVTAHYSDGTSKAVTGYTLDGTIADGENTVTVTYQGKTATFTVTGVAESGGGDIVATWESGVPYVKNVVDNEYVEKNGAITTYNNWSRTDYLNCYGASKIVYSGVTYSGEYNAFYDKDKKFISNFEALPSPEDSEVVVPGNAVYVVFSSMTSSVHNMVITPYA